MAKITVKLAVTLAVWWLLAGAAGAPGRAHAMDAAALVVDRVSAEQLVHVLHQLGHTHTQIDADGDVLVAIDDLRMLAMVGSYQGVYVSLQVPLVDAHASLADMNSWNRREPYARAYLNDSGYPVLGAELSLVGGVTVARIENFVRTFTSVSVPSFARRMGR